MSIPAILLQLFHRSPRIEPGMLVNNVHLGHVIKTDGKVLNRTSSGYLVEWAAGGSSVLPADQLCQIAA